MTPWVCVRCPATCPELCRCVFPQVNGYPSSPFSTKSFVFTNKFKELYVLDNMLKGASYDRPCNNDGQCMDGHILNIEEFMADFGLNVICFSSPIISCVHLPVAHP